MADNPNLFPALSAEDRARLASIAGNLESLPELLSRLMGYTADMAKVRAGTPALVGPGLYRSAWQGNKQLDPLMPAPLPVAIDGLLLTRNCRNKNDGPIFTIPVGLQVSTAVRMADFGCPSTVQGAFLLFDDLARAAAEVITIQATDEEIPTNWWSFSANILAATVGIVGIVNTAVAHCKWIRLRSAVVVAAERKFTSVMGA